MHVDSETAIIKRYQKVIDALIPYQQSGKLLEGLNKFSSRLPSTVRGILKEEVIRLTSLTDAAADNSDFASYPVQRFNHFGIDMKLDKVGQKILLEETAKYLDRYTVGVFESVMNSEHYQSHIKKEQQKKIAKAFTVQAQSFNDIDFGEDLAIRPRISVVCPSFEKGRHCNIASLSPTSFKVETNRLPTEKSEDGIFTFTFPETKGLCEKGARFYCEKVSGEFNKSSGKFETLFRFVPPTSRKQMKALAHYIQQTLHMLPLERDLEVERVIQNLDRDLILANSPWIPVFLSSHGKEVQPSMALMSQVNFEFNGGFDTLNKLPSRKRLSSLMPELKKFSETFVLRGVFNTKKGPVTVMASFRELRAAKIFAPFIKMINQTQHLSVLHLRLSEITESPKQLARQIHDMSKKDYAELDDITYVLFCKDVSKQIGTLSVPKETPQATFSSVIIDSQTKESINVVLEPSLDRRSEPRYQINKAASVKTGLISSIDATLKDLSVSGLRLELNGEHDISKGQLVKVSVPELKLRNEKYSVIDYEKTSNTLRLRVPQDEQTLAETLASLVKTNAGYFKTRDIAKRQQNIYRFLWEVSIRKLPCVAILVTQNRHLLSRLSTVYGDFNANDLYPFRQSNNAVQLDGLLADKNTDKPVSSALKKMLSQAEQDMHVVHALKPKDKRIIHIEEDAFMFGKVREQITEHVHKGNIEACVTQLNAMKCKSHFTPLTQKRLAFISSIDVDLYEKLKDLQKVYSHVIYVTNMSSLHNAFLASELKPVPQTRLKETDKSAH